MEQNSTYTFNLDYTKYECSYLHFTWCSGSVFNFVKDFMKSFREKFCATINFYLKLLKVIPANNIFVHFVLFLSFLIAFIFLRHLILSPWHKKLNWKYWKVILITNIVTSKKLLLCIKAKEKIKMLLKWFISNFPRNDKNS